jgi:putative acetyltransferase
VYLPLDSYICCMIRPFRVNDMESVLKIWLDASIQTHSFMPAAFWKAQVPLIRDQYLPMSDTYVYQMPEQQVVGFISLVNRHIAALFVDPLVQNQGIGHDLIGLAKFHTLKLTTCVFEANTRAIQFYQREGFQIHSSSIEKLTGMPQYEMKFVRC